MEEDDDDDEHEPLDHSIAYSVESNGSKRMNTELECNCYFVDEEIDWSHRIIVIFMCDLTVMEKI